MQDRYDDTSETNSDEENVKDDAILTTLKATSKVTTSTQKTRLLQQQQHEPVLPPGTTQKSRHGTVAGTNHNIISNNLYSMVLETSETTISPASQSVQSTDLSSHMSSVMLKPLARVRVSNHSSYSHRV